MDCGEGTYGQLLDHFETKAVVDDVLLKTRVFWISHMHGDHCLGADNLFMMRDQLVTADSEPVYVVYPPTIGEWITLLRQKLRYPEKTILIPI